MNVIDLIEKSDNKELFENIIHTIVMDSVEYKEVPTLDSKDATREMLMEDEELQQPKTEDEIYESMHDNANDALIIMAEPLFQFIHELCLLHYDELKNDNGDE